MKCERFFLQFQYEMPLFLSISIITKRKSVVTLFHPHLVFYKIYDTLLKSFIRWENTGIFRKDQERLDVLGAGFGSVLLT